MKGSGRGFEVLSRHLPGRTEENHEKPQDNRSLGRYLNPGPPECEAGALITILRRLHMIENSNFIIKIKTSHSDTGLPKISSLSPA
jgi:hypothetical protein